MERQVVKLLKERGKVLTTAESCTGGMIASRIVNVPGASAVFKEGYITYSDEAKHKLLGVSKDIISKYYAVSEETARAMAIGGAKVAQADVCIAVTGVAGPSEEDGKPVGLVYIACYCNKDVKVIEHNYVGDRAAIRQQAAEDALKLIVDMLG